MKCYADSLMDPVFEIKARLPIDELVGGYCTLLKKGRHLHCICPFHNDSHPSMLVSPEKGIAYCFACNSGGDIFSFYQKIEGVDFRQALKDLGERAGVDVSDVQADPVKKDLKDRLRSCLEEAQKFYAASLAQSETARKYLDKRGIPEKQTKQFGLGYAPDSFSHTYEHLLKQGFSKSEILQCGLVIQKDLSEGKVYDRFRNRLMFPIHDHQGKFVAFGGRTLGDDDAKYINSAESPLYHKSSVLYGYHHAKEAMRESKKVVMVEGYFDVLACHRSGVHNAVAVCGTAFTTEQAKILKRSIETVVLCLDQDAAGRQAAERAYHLCSGDELHVHIAVLPEKDPDEMATKDPKLLTEILSKQDVPYLDFVLQNLSTEDVTSVEGKRLILSTMLPLLDSIPTAVEQSHYLAKVAGLLGTTETVLKEDLVHFSKPQFRTQEQSHDQEHHDKKKPFSSMEFALVLFLFYPQHRHLLDQLIFPEGDAEESFYTAVQHVPEGKVLSAEMIDVPEEERERLSILLLYCENHLLTEWSDTMAEQEMKKNCRKANRDFLQRKQRDIARQLTKARTEGRRQDEAQLATQYQQVLKLSKMAL